MEICKNINSGKAFVLLDAQDNIQAQMITPQGVVKELEYDLFTEPIEVESREALKKGEINSTQYEIYHQYFLE